METVKDSSRFGQIYNLHKTVVVEGVMLVYEGEFTQEITKAVLSMAERNLDSLGEEESIKRKVFNVMVECLQNVCKHAGEMKELKEKTIITSSIFMIGSESNDYFVISGNSIKTENVESLKSKLEKINSLDKDGLKKFYKEIIMNTSLSDKGGAGLGFVDMARKSGNKLEFEFLPMDDARYHFFCLKIKINKG